MKEQELTDEFPLEVGNIFDFSNCSKNLRSTFLRSDAFWGIVTKVYEDGSGSIYRGTKEQVEAKKRELGI